MLGNVAVVGPLVMCFTSAPWLAATTIPDVGFGIVSASGVAAGDTVPQHTGTGPNIMTIPVCLAGGANECKVIEKGLCILEFDIKLALAWFSFFNCIDGLTIRKKTACVYKFMPSGRQLELDGGLLDIFIYIYIHTHMFSLVCPGTRACPGMPGHGPGMPAHAQACPGMACHACFEMAAARLKIGF